MSKFAILFLLFILMGTLVTLINSAVWGFYVYEIIYFLNPTKRWWFIQVPDISYSFYIVIIMLISFLFRMKDYQHNKIFEAPQTKWLILLFILFFVSGFFAINPKIHNIALYQFGKLLCLITLGYKLIDSDKKLDFALFAYVIGATYIGWEAFNIGRDGMGRVEGIGTIDSPDANGAAAIIAPAIVMLIYFTWLGSNKIKLVMVFMSLWIVNGLVLLNSRGAFLGVVVGTAYLLVFMFYYQTELKWQRLSAGLVITVGCLGALYLSDDLFWERMLTLKNIEDTAVSGSGRVFFWLQTFTMIEGHPFGLGASGFQTLSPLYFDAESLSPTTNTRAVHSSWFQALSELGWAGLFVFLSLIAASFKLTKTVKNQLYQSKQFSLFYKVVAVEGAFISYLIASSFIDQFRTEIMYWFILFMACIGNIYLFSRNKNV